MATLIICTLFAIVALAFLGLILSAGSFLGRAASWLFSRG